MMKKWIVILEWVTIQLVAGVAFAANQPPDNLNLVVGEQQMINAVGIQSFSESTKGVIQVKIPRSGKQLLVTAVAPGTTSLLLIDDGGKQTNIAITVYATHPDHIINEVQKLMKRSTGLTYLKIGQRVFVDGAVASEAELRRLEQLATLYNGQLQVLAQVGALGATATNVRLDLTFIEVDKSDTWNGGIGWPGSLGSGGQVEVTADLLSGLPTASYRVANQAMPSINAAMSRGDAKIKKQAHLLTTDGNEAIYESGGEINIPIAGSQAAELRQIRYGCTLRVTPKVNEETGQVDLKVSAEVSELRQTDQDAPGRTISKVDTVVHLSLGQTVVLSGLDGLSKSRSRKGIPFLSQIPIIGMLFGTHEGRTEQTNGLIAITPVVLHNPARESRQELAQALKRFNANKLTISDK